MESSQGSSNSPAPFLTKTYEMVDDPTTNAVVSWGPTNTSFVVWNLPEFARDLLPKYFKHNNFSSFVRQLNTYGFHKIDPDQWEFANEDFIRGQRHLLKNIHRRKPIHSHSLHPQGHGPLAETERRELEEEIMRLKCDKDVLILELQKHTQQQTQMDQQMQTLEERLQVMEHHQRSLIAFLSQIIHRPGFLSNFVQQSDYHSKKRRLPKADLLYEDVNMDDNEIAHFQAFSRERSDILPMYAFDTEPFDKMESSLNTLENFFRGVSHASGEDIYYDDTVPCLPSAVVLTEMHTSSVETDADLQSSAPNLHPCSPCIGEIHLVPELAESTGYAENPSLPITDIHADTRSKISEIDVNSEPAGAKVDSSNDRVVETAASAVPVNDVFWERFLSETPGSSDAQEVQSRRREADERRNEGKVQEHESIGWNRKNVEHLTEKMVHLTSAEKT